MTVASPSPFMVRDDVAAALVERGVTVYASSQDPPEASERALERLLDRVLGEGPGVLIDVVGMGIDALTPEQERYLRSWRE